ncbi:MAG: hypothetical protein GX235_02375 [Clostridiales bacterium]|nr:hypothetical protein [Clostridiales bacterium]
MKHYKLSRRLLTMALSVVLMLGILPVSAVAENLPAGSEGEIISFEPLPEETAVQTVAPGTPPEELNMPEALTATVRLAAYTDKPAEVSGSEARQEPVQNTESPQPEQAPEGEAPAPEQEAPADGQEAQTPEGETPAANQEDQTPAQEEAGTGYTQATVSVPVKWVSSPDYDCNTEGEYVFTAEAEGYTLRVAPPTITVKVQETAIKGMITAFEELTEDIRW